MAGSTCETEYIAASEEANEGVWMKEFISDLGVIPSASGPMKIFCDNTGPIALTKESRFHKTTNPDNSLAHRTTWLRSDFPEVPEKDQGYVSRLWR